jgi:hypothetical protein
VATIKTAHKLSVDQCLAISEHLRARSQTARGDFFRQLADTAAREDWPSSCDAPYHLLTEQEHKSICKAGGDTWQRIFVPSLTATELASLLRENKEDSEFAYREFGGRAPTQAELDRDRQGDERWERHLAEMRKQEARGRMHH